MHKEAVLRCLPIARFPSRACQSFPKCVGSVPKFTDLYIWFPPPPDTPEELRPFPCPSSPKKTDLKAPRAENSIPYHYYIPLYHANHTRVSHKNGSRLRGIRQDRRKEKRASTIASVYFFSVWLFFYSVIDFLSAESPRKKQKKSKKVSKTPCQTVKNTL
jgi:hypothetical protein